MNERSNGRFYVLVAGRKFLVEAIGSYRTAFGDSLDEACNGSIRERDSVITPENGFVNIGYSRSPMDYIARLLKGGPDE